MGQKSMWEGSVQAHKAHGFLPPPRMPVHAGAHDSRATLPSNPIPILLHTYIGFTPIAVEAVAGPMLMRASRTRASSRRNAKRAMVLAVVVVVLV